MEKKLLLDVINRYYILSVISPKHELLRFFCFNKENNFEPNQDEQIEDEFIERFRGENLSLEDYMKVKSEIPSKEYFRALIPSLFSNYRSVLEKEITEAMRN